MAEMVTDAAALSAAAGQVDIDSFSWGAETSAAEASGPMKESMETMKKAWTDASSTPEGSSDVDVLGVPATLADHGLLFA